MSTPVNIFDGRSTNSAMEITPIDLSDLGGNFSKYVQGDRVFYGTYGIWEVLKKINRVGHMIWRKDRPSVNEVCQLFH